MRKVLLAVVAFTLILGFVVCGSTSAHAASANLGKNSQTIQIGLSVDCLHLPTSQNALKVLAEHDLCGLGKTHSNSPNVSVNGNCGTLSLNLYNDGGGVMSTTVTVTSYWYLGPISKFVWSGTWYNNATASGGAMGDVVFGTGYTRISTTHYYTDLGSVVGSLTYAEDLTLLAISCTNASPLATSVYIG